MPAHISKSYFRNIRVNILDSTLSHENTYANANTLYLSTDSHQDARSKLFEIVNKILNTYHKSQIDFVLCVRVDSKKHQDYFANDREKLDKLNDTMAKYRDKKKQQRHARGEHTREFAKKTYHPQSRKRILTPDE